MTYPFRTSHYTSSTVVGTAIVNPLGVVGHTVIAVDSVLMSHLTIDDVSTMRFTLPNTTRLQTALKCVDAVVYALYMSRTVPSLLPTQEYSRSIRALRTAGAQLVLGTSSAVLDHSGMI